MKTEYRIICSGTGEGHRLHVYPKPTREKALAAVEANNSDPIYQIIKTLGCPPWKVEFREVSPWKEVSGILQVN